MSSANPEGARRGGSIRGVAELRPPSRSRNSLGASAAGALVLVFCGLLLWHDPSVFWNDDYQISILPVFADVARSWSEGQLPLLSPYSWVCGNLAGEFQYGTFSLFINAAIVLIWKLPLSLAGQAAALSMAHLFVLAAGAFLLARDRGLPNSLATMVALTGALNGWIICWGASDWFGALAAFAWLPWAWWGMERALDPGRTRWRFLWPAPFVYLLVTGGFPYTVLMLGLLSAWLAVKSLGKASLWPLALGLALGFGLAAPAILALLDYVHGSARAEQAQTGGHWQWLVPSAALPGFIWPGWTVRWADFSTRLRPHTAVELACGTVPPLALLAGLIGLRGGFIRRMKWELGLLALVLTIAMLPSANLFRWSFRWLPLLHLVLALVAAEALAQFSLPKSWRWLAVALVFGSLLATYLFLPTNPGVPEYHFASSLTKTQPLDPARLYLSVYPPPETAYTREKHPGPAGQVTRPGSTSMWAGLRLVNGYSPIRAAGVGPAWTFYTHGELDVGMAGYLLGSQAGPRGLLAILSVDGILVDRAIALAPKPASEWVLAHEEQEGRVYERVGQPLGRLHLLVLPNEKAAVATVRLVRDSRQEVIADVDVARDGGPARIVFARPHFPGYRAALDGRSIAVGRYRKLAPMIELPPGAHGRLRLVYRPWWLLLGGVAAGSCLLVMVLSCLGALREKA